MQAKILAVVEIILAYSAIRAVNSLLHMTGLPQWERETLGWVYSGFLIFIGVPALIIWLTRRSWAAYGVTTRNWRSNLDLGLKLYLVMFLPWILGFGSLALLKTSFVQPLGALILLLTYIAAIAVTIWVIRRHELRRAPEPSARANLILLGGLLLFPILLGLWMNRLNLVIISTVIWQFIFSGFGEEFVWRGYVQSRLNHAFGRPYCLFGVPFGAGLVIASLLFGLAHALNTYNPSAGEYSLAWGWAAWTTLSGLLFGILREKTGSLIPSGIAHGLPDAVGEASGRVLGWMETIVP